VQILGPSNGAQVSLLDGELATASPYLNCSWVLSSDLSGVAPLPELPFSFDQPQEPSTVAKRGIRGDEVCCRANPSGFDRITRQIWATNHRLTESFALQANPLTCLPERQRDVGQTKVRISRAAIRSGFANRFGWLPKRAQLARSSTDRRLALAFDFLMSPRCSFERFQAKCYRERESKTKSKASERAVSSLPLVPILTRQCRHPRLPRRPLPLLAGQVGLGWIR